MDKARAAGVDGRTSVVATEVQEPQVEPSVEKSDEELRRLAPFNAAARLMQANAQLAKAIAELLQVERQRRTIVERIQSLAAIFRHLNLSEQDMPVDGMTTKMPRFLDLMAGQMFDPALKQAEEDAGAKENFVPAARQYQPAPARQPHTRAPRAVRRCSRLRSRSARACCATCCFRTRRDVKQPYGKPTNFMPRAGRNKLWSNE